jgi:alpha-galactosidase
VSVPGPCARLAASVAIFAVIFGQPGDGVAARWNGARPATTVASSAYPMVAGTPGVPRRPSDAEIAGARRWLAFARDPNGSAPPFSFTYGGQSSRDLLPGWGAESASRRLGRRRTQHTFTWHDPATGLIVRCVAIEYEVFPTIEWSLSFENAGAADTPILEAINALDIGIERGAGTEFLLHHNVGSRATRSDFAPIETPLGPGVVKRIGAAGGRPTGSDLSYFNVAWGGEGLLVAVGWPGQWAAELSRDQGPGLAIRAGQELTHFRLHPGERVRTPLVALQSWRGDWGRGQNIWRRWMTAYTLPRQGRTLPRPQLLANSSRAYMEMENATEANQIAYLDRYRQEHIKLDGWWMDAGWYVQQQGWTQTGTWVIDPARFPHGFKPISDAAHRRGMKIVLWFEPERVAPATWLADTHPEWVLGGRAGGLLDLGNPDAWNWLVDHIDRLLTDNDIDVYRQDLNIDPLPYWRRNDAPDRQGITEIRHVTGYLAFWDELRRRHPRLLIDSCASGGRRNDLETMRRAVPLWRSDHAYEPIGQQGMTYGLSMWLPYYGTGTVAMASAPAFGGGWTPVEKYAFWSDAAPSLVSSIDVRVEDLDYAALRTLFRQWRTMSRFYSGDYYPLTPYSQSEDDWMAWQFDRPGNRDGVVQVFRRARCEGETIRLKLRGLDPTSRYAVRALGGSRQRPMSGRRLMEMGMPVTVREQPGTTVILYRATGASASHTVAEAVAHVPTR